jgi:hypothetical protein
MGYPSGHWNGSITVFDSLEPSWLDSPESGGAAEMTRNLLQSKDNLSITREISRHFA